MSKMFELLQQAQRDQELLRRPGPAVAIHSRNLDVLHRTGMDQQLFDIPAVSSGKPRQEPTPLPSGVSHGETFKLVQQLFLTPNAMSPRAVVFCGVEEDGGRDWICAQAAELLAHSKQGSICVVDANVSRPELHSYFGVANVRGLTASLVEKGPVTDFTQEIGSEGLRFLSAGEQSTSMGTAAPLAASSRLAARVRELRSAFDYVLLNAPAATRDSVTGYLSSLADGVVLIVEPSFTPRHATRQMKEEIEAAGGRVLGVVLHRRTLSLSDKTNAQPQGPDSGPAR